VTLKGVLLDVDGTLVLSNDAHAHAWVEAFAAYDQPVPYEAVRPLIGMGGDKVIPKLVPGLTDKDGIGKAIGDRRKELILTKFASQLIAASGSRALVQKLQASGLHLIVASSATAQELEVLLKVAEVDDLLPEATTSNDAESSKPSPDIVNAALQKGQWEPHEVVMLGDTPFDIEAADQAGVSVIAVRCGGFSDAQLAGAIAIYNDPADLLTQYEQSPLAQAGSQ
jgi:HAD superfamily hydrolase (TIGR01509 family)